MDKSRIYQCTVVGWGPGIVEAPSVYLAAEAFAAKVYDRETNPVQVLDIDVRNADEAFVVRVCCGSAYSQSGWFDTFAAISKARAT